jgi:hypothetical protein
MVVSHNIIQQDATGIMVQNGNEHKILVLVAGCVPLNGRWKRRKINFWK